jgi:hypothetical protein
LPAFAQQTAPNGYIACPGGEAYVYLYQSPTDFTALANLHCGTKVEIIGTATKGYVAVRTSDGKQGYVPQSAVTAAPPAAPKMESTFTASGEKPARAASAGPFFGNVARAEVFAGYSYLNMDFTGMGGIPRQSANGFQGAMTLNANRWLAAEGTFNWDYKGNPLSNATFYDYAAMGGPRVSIRPFFVHALFGLDRLTASLNGSPTFSQNSIAGAIGAGGEWRIRPHWAVYTAADYVLARHSLPGNPATWQSNIRVSGGVVFRIGGSFADRRN